MNSNQRTDLVREIERAIDVITEQADQSWLDNIDDMADAYGECFDASGVLKDFEANYNSRSIGITDYDDLDGAAILALLKSKLKPDEIVDLILECSDIKACDYYIQWNEVASVQIGETEYQIDADGAPELFDLINKASPEELQYLRLPPSHGSILVYGCPCDRLIWKVDPELVLERLVELVELENKI